MNEVMEQAIERVWQDESAVIQGYKHALATMEQTLAARDEQIRLARTAMTVYGLPERPDMSLATCVSLLAERLRRDARRSEVQLSAAQREHDALLQSLSIDFGQLLLMLEQGHVEEAKAVCAANVRDYSAVRVR